MPDYTKFKKTFCDCCKTGKDNKCCLGLKKSRIISDNIDFIDWEEIMSTKDAPTCDLPRCDAIYVRDKNTFFIEHKNIKWFLNDDTNSLKESKETTKYLLKKFTHTKEIFIDEGNKINKLHFICSFDINQTDKSNFSLIERYFRNVYSVYMEGQGILIDRCDKIAYYVIHGTAIHDQQ